MYMVFAQMVFTVIYVLRFGYIPLLKTTIVIGMGLRWTLKQWHVNILIPLSHYCVQAFNWIIKGLPRIIVIIKSVSSLASLSLK